MDPRSEDGTVAHYLDAAYYDQMYRRRMADRNYYASRACGQMLELGAGTGRVSIPVARALADQGEGSLLGLESVEEMRTRADAKLRRQPRRVKDRLRFEAGDFRAFGMAQQFDQIIAPFNALMHLYTDDEVEACFRTVRRHLAPGGVFRFDILMPDARNLARNSTRLYRAGTVRWPGTNRRYHCRERYRYDAPTQIQHIELAYINTDDPLDIRVVPLSHRQFFPRELQLWLRSTGFDIIRHDGGFDAEYLDEDSESQVVVCRAST